MTSTSYREPGLGESQEMESIMKRAAEMDRTKLWASILSRVMRYLTKVSLLLVLC